MLIDGDVKDPLSSSSEGMESVDKVRTKELTSRVVSLAKLLCSRSGSSGGLKSMSQDCGLELDIA